MTLIKKANDFSGALSMHNIHQNGEKINKSALTILANFLYSCVFYLKPQCNNSSGLLVFILHLSHKEEMVGWCFIKFSPIFLEI